MRGTALMYPKNLLGCKTVIWLGCSSCISIRIVKDDFHGKTRTREEHFLIQHAAFTPNCRTFLPTSCFVHRVDANAPVFREETIVDAFQNSSAFTVKQAQSSCQAEHMLIFFSVTTGSGEFYYTIQMQQE
jgi:hypothetical protein